MFQIFPVIDNKRYRITVVPLGEYNLRDRYLVRGGEKEVVMYNDRPAVKQHSVIRPYIWEIEGKSFFTHNENVYKVGRMIEKYMRENGHWD